MNAERTIFYDNGWVILGGLVAFLMGGVGLAWGFLTQPMNAFYAYLSAYTWAVSTVLGALIFLMIVHAMDAKWPVAIRRVIEGVVSILPLAVVGFLPIVLGLKTMYPWASPNVAEHSPLHEIIAHQRPYLNTPSFFVRAAIYFVIWVGIGALLRQWSLRQDMIPDARHSVRARILSAVGLFPVGLSLTFASFDWLMSLTPAWNSTMFGVYWFAGGFLAATSLLVLLTGGLQSAGLLTQVKRSHYYALGRLMLTFTIFWAYAAYFQVFLIWIADKPQEVLFYTVRATKEWFPFTILLAIVHFVGPFFVLLSYRVKQSPRTLAPVAAWLLVAHWLDMEWLIMPSARPLGPAVHWLDVSALICVAGVALAYGTFRLRGCNILPKNDPALSAALRYESH